jgi:hypothetical protein
MWRLLALGHWRDVSGSLKSHQNSAIRFVAPILAGRLQQVGNFSTRFSTLSVKIL